MTIRYCCSQCGRPGAPSRTEPCPTCAAQPEKPAEPAKPKGTMSRACARCGRRINITSRYCTNCAVDHAEDITTRRRQAGRGTAHWEKIRAQRLALDGHRCQLQLDDRCTTVATTVHLAAEARGNHRAATLANTRSACRTCHGIADSGGPAA